MLIYRDHQRSLPARPLRAGLSRAITGLDHPALQQDCGTEALLRAAELECALADARDVTTAEAAQLTDAVAARWLGLPLPSAAQLNQWLDALSLPNTLTLSTPEGYAYYGLSPQAYAELARGLPLPDGVFVVGVRSIGTSLAAVVSESLRARGARVQRTSVRPEGHPFRRSARFDESQRASIERLRATDAAFLVVDEGPGMSGSTLLSVADALEACGIPPERIWLLCSQAPNVQRSITPNAAARFERYHCHVAAPSFGSRHDIDLSIDLSGGAWRAYMFRAPSAWPACWPQRERLKGLSVDQRYFDKFEGLPPYRAAPLARAQLLAQQGYSPVPSVLPDGFVRYEYLDGRPARCEDLGERLLAQIARYCAFRSRAFPAHAPDARPLADMLSNNVADGLSVELDVQPAFELRNAVISDGRMQPHEWRITSSGRLYKTDGNTHGDDHLLPGPTDIAWDLAGAIVEWRMPRAASQHFVASYEVLSGDRAHRRLPAFVAAYCALRMGEMDYAAMSTEGEEAQRARGAQAYYRSKLCQVLREQGWSSDVSDARAQPSEQRRSSPAIERRASQVPPA